MAVRRVFFLLLRFELEWGGVRRYGRGGGGQEDPGAEAAASPPRGIDRRRFLSSERRIYPRLSSSAVGRAGMDCAFRATKSNPLSEFPLITAEPAGSSKNQGGPRAGRRGPSSPRPEPELSRIRVTGSPADQKVPWAHFEADKNAL